MNRKPKLILATTLLILAPLALAIFNDSIRAKMFFFYPLRPSEPSTAGLVGYWPLDGNALDKSGNGNNGTLTGTTDAAGKISGAKSFNQTSDYITLPTGVGARNLSQYSVSAWFKIASDYSNPGTVDTIYREDSSSANYYRFYFGIQTDNTITGQIRTSAQGAGVTLGTATTYADNTWHHVAMIYDDTNDNHRLYVDGVLKDDDTTNLGQMENVASSANPRIGALPNDATASYFGGSIDDVRIYNRALSADEIKEYYDATSAGHYTAGSPSVPASVANENGMVGYWDFDDCDSCSTAADRSGNGNTGTLTGANGLPTRQAGKIGNGLQFDGVDDYVSVANESNFDLTGDYTISFWVNVSTLPVNTFASLILKRSSTYNDYTSQFITYIDSRTASSRTNALLWSVGNNGTGAVESVSNGYFTGTANTWVFVTMVMNGTTMWPYKNGSALTTQAYSGTRNVANDANVEIGRYNSVSPSNFINAMFDDVRIYNRALSQAEITNLYNSTRKITVNSGAATNNVLTSGLVGHWTFDGPDTPWTSATAATTIDKSGSANTGTLTSMNQSSAPTEGVFGQGLQFDGVNDYVGKENVTSGLPTSAPMTVSAWVKPSTINSSLSIVGHGTRSTSPNQGWTFYISNNDLGFVARSVLAYDTSNANITIVRDEWQFVAAVFDSDYDVTFYNYYAGGNRESQKVLGSSDMYACTTTCDLSVGAQPINGFGDLGNQTAFFSGLIDDVRIYNRALSEGEIQQLYNLGR